MSERIAIDKASVQKKLEEGFSKEAIRAEDYPTLNNNQWQKALKAMGLSSVRAKKIDFVITESESKDENVNFKTN